MIWYQIFAIPTDLTSTIIDLKQNCITKTYWKGVGISELYRCWRFKLTSDVGIQMKRIFRMISNWKKPLVSKVNPFKPEFTIVIFIHYKPRIAVAILDL